MMAEPEVVENQDGVQEDSQENREEAVKASSEQDAVQASEQSEEKSADSSNLEAGEQVELIQEEPAEFVDESQMLSLLESLLFASERPVSLAGFKAVFKGTNIKTKDIKTGLEQLAGVYAEPNRGVTLEEVGPGWQLRTKADNQNFLKKLGKVRPFKLSGPALEVLSIIAYKQPLIKSEIDHIRGVESGHLVRALMDRGLACFQGKSELPGKPMQYGTTRKFLEIFGLRNLKELPSLEEIDQLLPDGIGYEDEKEKLSDVTDSMSEAVGAKYSEGEEELEKITEKLSAIDTSSEFFEEEKRRQREKRDREKARDIKEASDLGDDVPDKDLRWLERYEQKLADQEAEKDMALEDTSPESHHDSSAEESSVANDNHASEQLEANSLEDRENVLADANTSNEPHNGESLSDGSLQALDVDQPINSIDV